MNILAIECTHQALSVALSKGGEVFEANGREWKRAAESLVPLVEKVMADSGLLRKELDAVALSAGPGSFTALRIGMATAKGIAFGLGITLIAVPTMPAMAAALPSGPEMIVAVVPSRKGEYYIATYRAADLAAGVWHDEVGRGDAEAVAAAAKLAVGSGATTVVGRGLHELQPTLSETGAIFMEADFFSAKSLFAPAIRLSVSASAGPPGGVVPDYRQLFVPNVGGV
ncbi:MAG: tRNA (adenosine(37)-N6)-threonylcarbamoyltransferase complex dimerization subunit type 1 TsaB [Chlorobiaceae bacterium]